MAHGLGIVMKNTDMDKKRAMMQFFSKLHKKTFCRTICRHLKIFQSEIPSNMKPFQVLAVMDGFVCLFRPKNSEKELNDGVIMTSPNT